MFKKALNSVGTGDFNYEIRMYYFIVKVLFFSTTKSVKRRDKCRHVFWRRTRQFDKVVHNVTRLECLITLKNKYRQDL